MYDKVIAYPSGKVEYYYKDKIVTTGKDGIPRIRIRLYETKESNGALGLAHRLYGGRSQFSMDQLYNDLSGSD